MCRAGATFTFNFEYLKLIQFEFVPILREEVLFVYARQKWILAIIHLKSGFHK